MSDLNFDGRVVLITGAARGLGRAYAELVGSRGARLVINDVHGASAAVEELRAQGLECVADEHDISSTDGAKSLVDVATKSFGRLDAVINNAGVVRDVSILDESPEDWERVLSVNLTGSFNVTKAAWPVLADQGYGRVVNTTSAAGMFGLANNVAYGSSKAGIYGLTRGLAVEGEPLGIKVNAISPGAFTPMVAATALPPEMLQMVKEQMPVELVAPAAAVLAHQDCPVTGRVLDVSSGRVGEVFVATTTGIFDRALTPESLLAQWDTVTDRSEYHVLRNGLEAPGVVEKAAQRS